MLRFPSQYKISCRAKKSLPDIVFVIGGTKFPVPAKTYIQQVSACRTASLGAALLPLPQGISDGGVAPCHQYIYICTAFFTYYYYY